MKRFVSASLSVLALSIFASTANAASPVSGDSNPSDLRNPTVDTSEIINPNLLKARPVSGDSNPSDLRNPTVDTSEIIGPNTK
jgi:hypothetical protein